MAINITVQGPPPGSGTTVQTTPGVNVTVEGGVPTSPSFDSVTVKDLLSLQPSPEPTTPSANDVVVWNDTDKLKAKFDDGSTITIGEI